MSDEKTYDIFEVSTDEEISNLVGMIRRDENEFYLKLFYSYFDKSTLDFDQIKKLVFRIKELEGIDFVKIAENYIPKVEKDYIDLAHFLIQSFSSFNKEKVNEFLEKQIMFEYIRVIAYIYNYVRAENFMKLLPIFISLKKCKLKERVEILNLLCTIVMRVEYWNEKINFESVSKSLFKGDAISTIVYLNNLLDYVSINKRNNFIDNFNKNKDNGIDSFDGNVDEILSLLANVLEKIYHSADVEKCIICFDTLSVNIFNGNFYNEEWLKMFFNSLLVIFERLDNSNLDEVKKRLLTVGYKKVLNCSNPWTPLLALSFSEDEILSYNYNYEWSLCSYYTPEIIRKLEQENLLEFYKEYVEPLTESDYEEEVDFGKILKTYQKGTKIEEILGKSLDQIWSKKDENVSLKSKVKVYVAPRKTE